MAEPNIRYWPYLHAAGLVNAAGVLQPGSVNCSGIQKLGTGAYLIFLGSEVSPFTSIISLTLFGSGEIFEGQVSPSARQVFTADSAGVLTDADFSFEVKRISGESLQELSSNPGDPFVDNMVCRVTFPGI